MIILGKIIKEFLLFACLKFCFFVKVYRVMYPAGFKYKISILIILTSSHEISARFNRDGLFSIDPDTGIISLSGSLDRETAPSHELVVRATDNGLFVCLFAIREYKKNDNYTYDSTYNIINQTVFYFILYVLWTGMRSCLFVDLFVLFPASFVSLFVSPLVCLLA